MHLLSLVLVSLFFLFTTPATAERATWNIDSKHSSASFSVRHMMISNVRGNFDEVAGTVLYDGKNIEAAKVDATIKVATINTRELKRDNHLRGPEFFDVVKYPTITFKSKIVERLEDGKFKLTGELTIHGVTKEVTLNVDGPTQEITDPHGNKRIGASATTHLNRKDFGLVWNDLLETGGAMVGDDVKVELEVELIKQGAPNS